MDVKQMTYILTIAREGGISKAAKQLFITQSALDQQLLKLEKELGIQLFYRSRSSLTPTPAGKVYVSYAEKMVAMKEEAFRVIRDMAEQQRGSLSLTFTAERGMEMFLDLYPRFSQVWPQIDVRPQAMGERQQLDLLQEDKVDLGFIFHDRKDLPGLDCTTLLEEEFVLIVPLTHPLAQKAAPEGQPLAVLPISCLRKLTLCLVQRQSTQREVIDPLLRRCGGPVALFMETDRDRDSISMVRRGMCCSIVPYYDVKGDHTVARFRLEGCSSWRLSVCCRRGHYLSQAARYFIQLAQGYYQGQQAEGSAGTASVSADL